MYNWNKIRLCKIEECFFVVLICSNLVWIIMFGGILVYEVLDFVFYKSIFEYYF